MVITMGTSGSESLNAAANIFIGQTEAPLMIKPYVESMTKFANFISFFSSFFHVLEINEKELKEYGGIK